MKKILFLTSILALALYFNAPAQFFNSAEELIYFTKEWK